MRGPVEPKTGEVWSANLDPTLGREQAGIRPVLVISNAQFNETRNGLFIIAPLTGTDRRVPAHLRVEAGVAGLTKASFILCDQVRTISDERLLRRWGDMPGEILLEARQVFGRFVDAHHIY
jgi:mRNA interferase MazF